MEYFANCCGCCDPPPEECCIPPPCVDLEITFENTSIDGTYWAEWFPDEEPLGWRLFQEETGDCIWRIRANDPIAGGANSVVELGPLLLSVGGETIVGPIDGKCSRTINLNFGDFCGVQTFSNATMTITWTCAYPEYFEIISGLEPADFCDCVLEGQEVPIICTPTLFCSNSTSGGSYTWCINLANRCDGDGAISINITYICADRELTVEFGPSSPIGHGVYSIEDISLTKLNSGDIITLDRVSFLYDEGCNYPLTIEIQGHNPGYWC